MRNIVLVAHPDPERVEALCDSLSDCGYSCLTAQTGPEAMATALNYRPQLAVLHVDLPEVQGTDVCLRLKQEEATQKMAIMLIGKESVQERFVSKEVGADVYVSEPVDNSVIIEKVRDLFSNLLLNAR